LEFRRDTVIKTRALHKIVGLVLLIPFMGWIVTAMVFYIKPGYAGAYESLQMRFYPVDGRIAFSADPSWLEFRYVKTILGTHVIVRTVDGWRQLDPPTLRPREKPTDNEIRTLLNDAFTANSQRYGVVAAISNDSILTSTGVHVSLDWDGLSLYQRGPDTDRIDFLYKVHYLQWTGIAAIDKVLGPIGLALVFLLSVLGIRLALRAGKINV